MADKDKAQGKVEIKIGNMSFTAEGDQEWLGEQLSKVIGAAGPSSASPVEPERADTASQGPVTGGSLAAYIKAKGGEDKQVQRFLAAAAWLFRRGQKDLNPSAIARALQENHQKKLANSADCLNKNVSKGYCEKTKDGFFVTPEGWAALGEKV